ncbi:hypothetical protein Poli38472_009065 [Pythium oligandrum]|uniref:Uncharacterized protein n=1 Tax=Pythium oligandrum TaxID=41045 RepID=A0A8K1CM87_PYTOL|nr:hypothetical protein Poli38472_009065 [Pythium oligandrum]|eukprot:TMW64898.1 hypothetical protein Poli38472_009065 [Pythium oligandrum]
MLPTRATLQMPKRVLSLDMADILKTRIANGADAYQWQLICAIDAVLKNHVTMTPAQAYDFRETVDGLAFFTFRTLEGDWRHDAMALVYVAGHSEGNFPWYLESSDSKLFMRVDDVVAFQSTVRERVSLYRDAFLNVLLPAFDAGFDEFKPHARDELITRVYQVFQLVIGSWILEVLKSTKAVPNDCALPVSWIETRPLKPVVLKATKLPPLQLLKPLPLMATELKTPVTTVTPPSNVGGVVKSKQATPVTPRTPVILETPVTPETPITPMAQVSAVTPSTDEEFEQSSLGYCDDDCGAEKSGEPVSTKETTDSEDAEESPSVCDEASVIACDVLEVDDVTVPKSAKDDDDCQGVRASAREKVYMSVDDAIAAIAARSDHFEASILCSIDTTLTAHGVGTSSPADSSLRHALVSGVVKNVRDLVTEWGWDVMMAVEAMESISSSATVSIPVIKSSVGTQTTQVPAPAPITTLELTKRSTLMESSLTTRTPVIVPLSPKQDEGCSTSEGKPRPHTNASLVPVESALSGDSERTVVVASNAQVLTVSVGGAQAVQSVGTTCPGKRKDSSKVPASRIVYKQEQQTPKHSPKTTPPMVRDARGHRIHRPAGCAMDNNARLAQQLTVKSTMGQLGSQRQSRNEDSV